MPPPQRLFATCVGSPSVSEKHESRHRQLRGQRHRIIRQQIYDAYFVKFQDVAIGEVHCLLRVILRAVGTAMTIV